MTVRMFFLPVNAQILHERKVLDGEENCRFPADIGVLVPEVGGNDEEVAGAPIKDAVSDNASA